MSAARQARRLTRAALGLCLLAAGPLAAQPLEQATAPAAAPSAAPPVEAPRTTDPAPPAPKPSPRQQIAKQLFERGREKWLRGEYGEAVALLTASNEQAERAGTLLLLGESLEKLGRLRSAHDEFQAAARAAQRMHDPEAEARASTRAAALLPLIPRMEIRFFVPPPEGTLVTLNGVELPHEWLNRAAPFDAAEYRIDVRAPGHAPYTTQAALSNDGARLGVQVVPVTLTALPAPTPEPLGVPAAALGPEDARPSSQRQLAWTAGAVGAAAAVTGLVLTLVALDKKHDAEGSCEVLEGQKDPCSARGVDLREQASKLANLATLSAIASGAAFATSFALFVMSEESTTPTGAGIRYSASF
jgi:hypothetical protein